MAEIIDMGKISSRGQVAIPAEIRKEMGLEEASKIMFLFDNDTLMIKKITISTLDEIAKPIRERRKELKQKDIVGIIHKMRKKK